MVEQNKAAMITQISAVTFSRDTPAQH